MIFDWGRHYWQGWVTCFTAATVVSLAQGAPARGAFYALPQHPDGVVVETWRQAPEPWQFAQYSPQQRAQQQQLEALRRQAAAAQQQARAAAQRKAQARGAGAGQAQAAAAQKKAEALKAGEAQKKAAEAAAAQRARAKAAKQAQDAAAQKKAAEALKAAEAQKKAAEAAAAQQARAKAAKQAQDAAAQKKAAEALKAGEAQRKAAEAAAAQQARAAAAKQAQDAAAQKKAAEAVKAAEAQKAVEAQRKTAEALRRMGGEPAMPPPRQAGPQPQTFQNVMGAMPAGPMGALPKAGPSEAITPPGKPKPGEQRTSKHDRDALATAVAITLIMNLLDPPDTGIGLGPPDLLTPRDWPPPQKEATTYVPPPRVPEPEGPEPEPGDTGKGTKLNRAKPPWQQALTPVLAAPLPPTGEQPQTPDPVTPPGMSQAEADALAAKYPEPPNPADPQKLQDDADQAAAAAAQARDEAAAKINIAKQAKKALGPSSTWEEMQAQKKLAEDAKSAYGDYLLAKQKADELQQEAFAASPLGMAADLARTKANDAKIFTEAVTQAAVDAFAAPFKRSQSEAEQAARKAEADRQAAAVAVANAKHDAHVAQLERDRLETAYAKQVSDLAWNKYGGNENLAKMELEREAAALKAANERLELANKALKAAGQGGLGGAAAGITGHGILINEADKADK